MNGEPTKVRDVLRGRHTLVTGSSSGLGVEFAREKPRSWQTELDSREVLDQNGRTVST